LIFRKKNRSLPILKKEISKPEISLGISLGAANELGILASVISE
jgi:hypothetical protein